MAKSNKMIILIAIMIILFLLPYIVVRVNHIVIGYHGQKYCIDCKYYRDNDGRHKSCGYGEGSITYNKFNNTKVDVWKAGKLKDNKNGNCKHYDEKEKEESMKLLTQDIMEEFKKQGDTSEMEPKDIKVIMKLFNPAGVGIWYCYEIDEDEDVMWCFANLNDRINAECVTVSLKELKSLHLPGGLHIERDLWFKDHNLQEVIRNIRSGKWQ